MARAKSAQQGKAVRTKTERARLARVAKGRRPQYFSDPAIDKLLSITLTLAGELSVTRDRLDAVERLLEQRRILSPDDVDAYEPGTAERQARDARRAAYLDRILRTVQAELDEITREGMPKSQDEVIAAVAD